MSSTNPCPDPIDDPEGYRLWCELHPCTTCYGTGEVPRDSNVTDDLTDDCPECEGTGLSEEGRNNHIDEDEVHGH